MMKQRSEWTVFVARVLSCAAPVSFVAMTLAMGGDLRLSVPTSLIAMGLFVASWILAIVVWAKRYARREAPVGTVVLLVLFGYFAGWLYVSAFADALRDRDPTPGNGRLAL
jgi:hypothetical protein